MRFLPEVVRYVRELKWLQVLVLLAIGVVLSAIARRLARRWEYS